MIQLSSLAVFFAFIHLLIALPAIFAPEKFRKAALKMVAKAANIRLLAFIFFYLAYLILEVHPTVEKSWESVMSVLAYLLLIRGVVWLWWPDFFRVKFKKIVKHENGPTWMGLIGLAVSLAVGYLGFYVY